MEKSEKTASGVRNMIDSFSNGELKDQLRKYYQDSKKKKSQWMKNEEEKEGT